MMLAVRRRALFVASLASLIFAAGCSAATDQEAVRPEPPPPADDPGKGEPDEPPVEAVPFTIAWGSCSIPDPYGSKANAIDAECATVDATARRGVAGSGTTPVAVYRLPSKKQPATAQLWMLNGGPGGAGFGLARFGKMVTTMPQGIDVYLVDHRGTGESAFLECPRAMQSASSIAAFAEACSEEIREAYGDAVDGFSTTESSHDVRELIESTATADQKVFVYGGSYGSYWAHRLLQLPNVRVDAVVTDGNCLGDTCTFDTPQSFGVDEAMKNILDVCKDTPDCSARVGADPWAFAKATMQKVAEGHCSQTKLTSWAPSDVFQAVGIYWAPGVVPILHRLDRCAENDVAALDTLEENLRQIGGGRLVSVLPRLGKTPEPSSATSYSTALQMHVIGSELISRPAPSKDSLVARAASLTFPPDPESLDISYFDSWKVYPRDSFVGGWLNRDVPWLMMQGSFDFQTVYSLSEKALEHVKDPSIQLVRVDGGGHGVVFDSECSLSMLEAFLANPKAKVDASCVADVKAASLAIDPAYASYFFGTADAWD